MVSRVLFRQVNLAAVGLAMYFTSMFSEVGVLQIDTGCEIHSFECFLNFFCMFEAFYSFAHKRIRMPGLFQGSEGGLKRGGVCGSSVLLNQGSFTPVAARFHSQSSLDRAP